MTEITLAQKIKETKVFKNHLKFKQTLLLNQKNIKYLFDLWLQADKNGIEYLLQKQTIMSSDVALISEILENEKINKTKL